MIENKQLNLQFLTNLPILKTVEKLWGKEIWVVNSENYCMKYMELKPNYQCSLHMHPIKTETFIVQSGEMEVEIMVGEAEGEAKTANSATPMVSGGLLKVMPGVPITLPAGVWHRFRNKTNDVCGFLEISTHHSDDDVVRMEDSRRC
jgi:mannose-6-phosphate isomerase-like protein (cupin superfamily)